MIAQGDLGDQTARLAYIQKVPNLLSGSELRGFPGGEASADIRYQPPLIFTVAVKIEQSAPGEIHPLRRQPLRQRLKSSRFRPSIRSQRTQRRIDREHAACQIVFEASANANETPDSALSCTPSEPQCAF